MRILVVEDEKEIADGISRILEKANYKVDCVYDGLSGLDNILSGIYDLVLLDVMLPKINGFDIVKSVRSQGVDLPIIMLTAKSQVNDKITGLNIGADDYITKPFDGGELLARIAARLRKNNEIQDGRIVAFDISLDPTTYLLQKDERSVKVSKTEYQLLELFMINKNIIISKDTIINKIWGYGEMMMRRSIDQPINLFPSIHCLESWICFRGSLNRKYFSKRYAKIMGLATILVMLSTVLIKQHVIWDAVGAIIVSEVGLGLGKIRVYMNHQTTGVSCDS